MDSNRELVDYLVEQGRIETEEVERAFRNVDRADFVPDNRRGDAYLDRPLPIGPDSTISAPHMVALNTENLEPFGAGKVLEIGSGSGYQLAVLAELAGNVTGVERKKKLVENSRELLEPWENAEVVHGDGLKAVEDRRFDRILYSCGVDSIVPARKFLSPNGIILAPVNTGDGQILRRYSDGATEDLFRVSFVEMKKDLD